MFDQLVRELIEQKILVSMGKAQRDNPRGVGVLSGMLYGLSLEGWERYEAERRGPIAGRYGFMAMKFGDATLEALVEDVIKPEVTAAPSSTVVDQNGRASGREKGGQDG